MSNKIRLLRQAISYGWFAIGPGASYSFLALQMAFY